MITITLDFKGLFLLADLQKEVDAKKHGIYIWGFKYPNDEIFIPYYVGKASTKFIITRINDHISGIKSKESTYTRLTSDFMKEFYKYEIIDKISNSKKNIAQQPDWFRNFSKKKEIEYINKRWFIQLKTGSVLDENSNFPISLLQTPLEDFIGRNMDNMYICFAIPYENGQSVIPDKGLFERLESITKKSLKGRTVGRGLKSIQRNDFHYKGKDYSVEIIPPNFEKIFKINNNVVEASNDFPGY